LTRGDGTIVAALLAYHYLGQMITLRRPLPWLALVLFLAVTLPWIVFATSYFGSPLPATLLAKQR
jgi:hypothetical protein